MAGAEGLGGRESAPAEWEGGSSAMNGIGIGGPFLCAVVGASRYPEEAEIDRGCEPTKPTGWEMKPGRQERVSCTVCGPDTAAQGSGASSVNWTVSGASRSNRDQVKGTRGIRSIQGGVRFVVAAPAVVVTLVRGDLGS